MRYFILQTILYSMQYAVKFLEGVLSGIAASFGVWLFIKYWVLL